jgi:hypothetical protein
MADACCAPAEQRSEKAASGCCPGCGERGRPVELLTVQAQVACSLRELAPAGYRFCATLGCAVVYFAPAAPAITGDQLRERVFQKEPADDTPVCYCFQHTAGQVRRADSATQAAILADIVAGTRQGQCACGLRNPQGSCCLGNVRQLLALPVLPQGDGL